MFWNGYTRPYSLNPKHRILEGSHVWAWTIRIPFLHTDFITHATWHAYTPALGLPRRPCAVHYPNTLKPLQTRTLMDSVFSSFDDRLENGVSVHNGFPNAASDTRLQSLSLDQLLIPQPHSTYHFRVAGSSWRDIGVFDGDIALIDRSLTPYANDIVAWWRDDTFSISHFHAMPEHAIVWGVITATVHQWVHPNTRRNRNARTR